MGRLSRGIEVALIGSWWVRLLSGRVDRLLGRITYVLGVGSCAKAELAGGGVAAAAQYSEDDDCANYGSKADNANHKDHGAH
jgi:hypothetical protein